MSNYTLPIGAVILWTSSEIPENFLECTGQPLKKSEYPELYEVIGDTYNSQDSTYGTLTFTNEDCFRIPDFRRRFLVGRGGRGQFSQNSRTGGAREYSLTIDNLPRHSHQYNTYWKRTGDERKSTPNASETPDDGVVSTDYTGGNQTMVLEPPYFKMRFIIKVK